MISGEHFDKGEMTADIMSKVIAEYAKGTSLVPYLDKREAVDANVLDFGLASSVRNFEKSGSGALVPDRFKPSQMVFRRFLDNTRAAMEPYPFNNQLGWATCFAYTPPTESLKSGTKPLSLDDAEWFKGEVITAKDSEFVLSRSRPTILKACPGADFRNTDWTIEEGDKVRRLLRKAGPESAWLFVRTFKGFGWIREQPKSAGKAS